MADKQPKSALKKGKVEYEIVTDATGAIRRVPKGTTVAPPPVPVRTAITSTAVASSVQKPSVPYSPPAEEVPEEIVYGEPAPTGSTQPVMPAPTLIPIDEEEMVYDETGQLVIDPAAKAKQIAEAEAKAKLQAVAKATVITKPEPVKKSRKEKQADDVTKLDDVGKMRAFYRYRAKDPFFFKYTAEGNVQILADNKAKVPPMVITLRAFSELRPEELEEVQRAQKEKQEEIEKAYVAKMKELRSAYDYYDPYDPASADVIVLLNEQMRELSVARNKVLYPERWISEIPNPDTKSILLDRKQEERKLGYDVYLFKRNDMAMKDAVGHYRAHGEVVMGAMKGGETVVLFITDVEDQTTGEFHPAAEREFVYNETKYASPYQAFEVERFKEVEDEGMIKKLLGTRSAKTIKQLVSQEQYKVANPLQLWEDILEAFYTQFKDAAENLKATGSARFHMMDKVIGTPEYANALANVRTKLKERENDAPATADEVKQSVITKDEQQKAKVGAIINNFRRG